MGYHPTIHLAGRARRKVRVRKKVAGSAVRPRLSVFRSAKHVYAQVIDDNNGVTLAAASSLKLAPAKKVDEAKQVGIALASACKDKGIDKVVFDRNGYRYHGRVKAVADGAREGGLQF